MPIATAIIPSDTLIHENGIAKKYDKIDSLIITAGKQNNS